MNKITNQCREAASAKSEQAGGIHCRADALLRASLTKQSAVLRMVSGWSGDVGAQCDDGADRYMTQARAYRDGSKEKSELIGGAKAFSQAAGWWKDANKQAATRYDVAERTEEDTTEGQTLVPDVPVKRKNKRGRRGGSHLGAASWRDEQGFESTVPVHPVSRDQDPD